MASQSTSKNHGYGSIAPLGQETTTNDLHPMVAAEHPDELLMQPQQHHHPPNDREIHVQRASRFLFMLTFVAIALFGAITTGDFVGDTRDANLTMSASTSISSSRGHDLKSVLVGKHYDNRELFFDNQALDHFQDGNKHTFSQRFYKRSKYWKGPGYPILVIMGGEGSLDLPMLYPYVNKGLAKEFHAFVMSPEHRFYGKSQPVTNPTNQELVKFLTPDQALMDAIQLIRAVRESLGCSPDPSSIQYCPVITFGGSYPGFLSAMMRFRFPDMVDIAYAASAPLELYSQTVDSNAYFDKVSAVAETASTGCANAVRSTLYSVREELLANFTVVKTAAKAVGFCPETFPDYIQDIPEFLSEAIAYLVPAVFADFNMAYYPPGPDTALERACGIFKDEDSTPMVRISKFYDLRGDIEYGFQKKPKCFDLSLELPSGPNARIRGADNSGTGGGFTGEIWEFQCCKDLIIRASYSEQSMFLPQPFEYAWLSKHCHERFEGVPMEPFRMVSEWKFNDLSQASRILFTVSGSMECFVGVRNDRQTNLRINFTLAKQRMV
jgi:pimeloyl-ACP methyl ester carboxylesterase